MDGPPDHIGRRRLAVDGIAEHVEHPRDDRFANRHLERPARVFHGHAASEPFRGIERDPADMMCVELHQHFDGDSGVFAGMQ